VIIERVYMGGSETIDLATRDGYTYFWQDVIQSFEAACSTIEQLKRRGEVAVNVDEPEFFERYIVAADGPVYEPYRYYLTTVDGVRKSGPYTSWEAADTDRRGVELFIEQVDTDDDTHSADNRHDDSGSSQAVTVSAQFIPQAWLNGHAIDIDPSGDTVWDATEAFQALPATYRAALQAELDEHGEAVDVDDMLFTDSNAPTWVREHTGPFTITVHNWGDTLHR
jgi:hypothetical protein